MAHKKVTAGLQVLIELPHKPVPYRRIKIDHDIPAENHMEGLPERELGSHQIEGTEQHLLADHIIDLPPAAAHCMEVAMQPVLRQPRQRFCPIDSRFRRLQHLQR